jgi:SAM-dependent methyltransferase
MIDFNLLNFAKNQLQKKIKVSFKLKYIKNLKDLKNILNIKYYAPINIIDLNEKEKFDSIISTNVIEHISKKNFEIILEKLIKIVKKDGILSFLIDYSDHYSHTDSNITSTNFLKYSELEFKKYNTPLLFQNRLRHYDYIDIFKNKKFKILKIIKGPKGHRQNIVSTEFRKNHKDLFVTWGYFLLKKI